MRVPSGWRVSALRCLAFALLCLAALLRPGLAQEAAPVTLPQPLTPELVDALVAQLTDAQVRQVLVDELNRQAAAAAAPPAPAGMPGLLDAMQGTIDAFLHQLGFLWLAVSFVPDDLPRVFDRLTDGGGVPRLLALLASFGAALLAAFAAQYLLRRMTARLRERLGVAPEHDLAETALRRLGLAGLELLRIGLFALVLIGVFILLEPAAGLFLSLVTAALAAIVLGWLITVATRLLLAPDAPDARPFRLSDAAAAAAQAWIARIVWVGATGWLTAILLVRLGLGYEVYFLVMAVTGLIAALLVVAAIWHARRPVAALIRGGAGGPRLQTRLRAAFAEVWHLLATVYALIIWAVWTVGLLTVGARRIDAAIGSLLVMAALPALVGWVRSAVAHDPGATPEAAVHQRPFRKIAGQAAGLLLILGAGLLVLRLWGLDIFAYTHGAEASPFWRAVFSIAVTVILAIFALRLIRAAVERRLPRLEPANGIDPHARARTLLPLLRSALVVFVMIVSGMIVLAAIGLDIGPLLASAGVAGIAIGFGAQSLVRDIFSGIFFLIDDAFRVGEYIESGSIRGTVEAISIRSIRLRHHRGYVHTVPFGAMNSITNYMRDWVIDKVTVNVAFDTDLDKAKKLIKDVGKELSADPEFGRHILETMKLQGVEEYTEYGIRLRIKMMTKPGEQFVIRRRGLALIKRAFDANGIRFASPIVQVAGGDAGAQQQIASAAHQAVQATQALQGQSA